MQSRVVAHHTMDTLNDDAPVTVGMLRASIDELGQGVGFVLSGALLEAGLDAKKRKEIAVALHTLTMQDTFHGPARDVLAGIVYGMSMQLQGTPDGVGKQA